MADKEFKLTCQVTVSAVTVVKAGSLAEAISIAANREMLLDFIGAGNDIHESWLVDTIDGEPENIKPESDHQKRECLCTLAQRLVGDGCSVCNPEYGREI